MPVLAPLTALRFFAALAIAVLHLQLAFWYKTGIGNFASAITFFFVLSGFILTYVYEDFPDRASILRYYVSRIARVWPLHLVTALYFLFFIQWPEPRVVVLNLLLVQSWSMELATAMAMNGVAWSLSVEVFFYLMFPFVIMTRRYWALWLLASAMVVVIGLVMAIRSDDVSEQMTGISWFSFLHVGPPARFLEFVAGVITAMGFRRYRRPQLSFRAWTALELAVLALLLLTGKADLYALLPPLNLPFPVIHWAAYSGSFPIMCAAVLCFAYGGGAVSRLLSLRPMVFLGEISFAIYMVHQLVLVTWLWNGWTPAAWDPVSLATISLQILAVSCATFLLVEKPGRSAIIRLLDRVARLRRLQVVTA